MSLENLEKFKQLVLADLSLQKELQRIAEHERFVARVVELGAEKGFEFTPAEVAAAMRENRRLWIERWL